MTTPISTGEHLATAVADLDALARRHQQVSQRQTDALEKARERYADDLSEIKSRMDDLLARIEEAVRLDPALAAGYRSGDVRIVSMPPAVEVSDEPALLAALREAGAFECIRLGKDQVDKAALKKRRPTVPGYTITTGQAVAIRPRVLDREIRVPLTQPSAS